MQKQYSGNCRLSLFEAHVLYLATSEAEVSSALSRASDRHALRLYCAVTEENKINMCLCADKEVSIT